MTRPRMLLFAPFRVLGAALIAMFLGLAGCGAVSAAPKITPLGPPSLRGGSLLEQPAALPYIGRGAIAAIAAARGDALASQALAQLWPAWREALAALDALGPAIAANAPVGLVYFDLEAGSTAAFATLRDPQAFAEHLGTSKRWRPTRAGDARIFADQKDSQRAIVVRDRNVFLITSAVESRRSLIAIDLATADKPEMLAHSPEFQKLVAELGFGTEVAGFAALDVIGASAAEAVAAWEFGLVDIVSGAAHRVDAAKARGASPADLAPLQAELRRQNQWLERARTIAAAEKTLATDVVSALGTIVFGLDTTEGPLRLKAITYPRAGSLADELVASSATVEPSLPGAPLAATARLTPATLRRVVRIAWAELGLEPAAAEQAVAAALAVPPSDLWASFDGRVELAIAAQGFSLRLGLMPTSAIAGEHALALGERSITLRREGEQLVVQLGQDLASAPQPAALPAGRPSLLLAVTAEWLAPATDAAEAAPPTPLRDDNDDVPFSDQYLRIENELGTIDKSIVTASAQLAQLRAAHERAAATALGALVLAAERDGAALLVYGGLRARRGGVAQMLQQADAERKRLAKQLDAAANALTTARAQRRALYEQLLEVRVKDIEAHDRAAVPRGKK